jgi:crotonobetainyl-CoA:carnitine CoA-transferase CaiB-like acyl-CoA transferase
MNDFAKGALTGLKVIDLSRVLGGPFAGQILADHGADVIKVEPPARDETRFWGPPFVNGTASYFLGLNRNKRAIALDLRTDEGKEILFKLLEDADVLLENFKSGTLEKWGMGYDEVLKERFPHLIHASVSGFGNDGPLGGMPGYDAVLQAMGGIMSVNGELDGDPTRVGVPVVDITTGLNMVIGILLAIHARAQTGKGQFVEASLFDAAFSLLHPHSANYFVGGKIPERSGSDHPNISPYSVYATRTKQIFLAVGNDGQFAKLCKIINAAHLATDPRFLTNGDRVTNRRELREALETALQDFDGEKLAPELIEQGVPAGAVLNIAEALNHPHTAHREMVVEREGYRGIGSPIKLTMTPASYRCNPPDFGEHTDDILAEIGISKEQIDALVKAGVVTRKT